LGDVDAWCWGGMDAPGSQQKNWEENMEILLLLKHVMHYYMKRHRKQIDTLSSTCKKLNKDNAA